MKFLLTNTARNLRRQQNPHEVRVWSRLRNRQFLGLKFRRQLPIGPYVVDFCCREKRLVLELDGGGHADPEQRQRDTQRDTFLESQGYRVMRIWTNEIEAGLKRCGKK